MDIVYIDNGLGNQMSQYAMYLRRKHEGIKVVYACKDKLHNGVELDKVFGVHVNRGVLNYLYLVLGHIMIVPQPSLLVSLMRKLLKLLGVKVICEDFHYEYHQDVFVSKPFSLQIISGGWHHWKYLEGIEDEIKDLFRFKTFRNKNNIEISIRASEERAVAIHIRRGDYMFGDNYVKFGVVCNEQYYKCAMTYIESIVPSPIYYIFSNDMEFAKNLLKGREYVCVDWNTKENSWADMALMSLFRNIIIANSTFSWWAAWLGSQVKNVICPPFLVDKDPSSDIFPPFWHHLVNY